jgi:hypothetical protein
MHTIMPESQGNVVGVRVTDKVTQEDLDTLTAEFEVRIRENGHLRLLIVLDDFHGWDSVGTMIKDFKMESHADKYLERVAMVGENKRQEWATKFSKVLTKSEVKYFDKSELPQAWAWVQDGG